jgi:hypothetical protein
MDEKNGELAHLKENAGVHRRIFAFWLWCKFGYE